MQFVHLNRFDFVDIRIGSSPCLEELDLILFQEMLDRNYSNKRLIGTSIKYV